MKITRQIPPLRSGWKYQHVGINTIIQMLYLPSYFSKMTRNTLLLFFLFLASLSLYGQSSGSVLIISKFDAHLMIDGEDHGIISANKPQKFELSEGEHYVQLFHSSMGTEKSSILQIEPGKQIVHKVELLMNPSAFNEDLQVVVDGQINIPGLTDPNSEQGSTLYYAFDKGDEIIIDFDLVNNHGKCGVSVFTYPDGNVKYSNSGFQKLESAAIEVSEKGIYGFTFTTTGLLDRTGQILIKRKSQSADEFNTEVVLAEVLTPNLILKSQEFYVNGGARSSVYDGKSRVIVPISLPENTVKWYYRFAAYREKEELEQVSGLMDLFGELANIIDETGTISFGIEVLSQPPGADYADVYLIDRPNYNIFLNKEPFGHYPQGTRENYKAGNVEIDCCSVGEWFLGIKNPANMHGINVSIEVVAVTKTIELKMKGQ